MDVKFCLVFPREALSVPVIRRVLGDTLRAIGVDEDSVMDILLAVTEACTNVLRHSGHSRKYEVTASVDRAGCLVEVVDNGRGFDPVGPRLAHGGGRPAPRPAPWHSRWTGLAARGRGAAPSGSGEVTGRAVAAKDMPAAGGAGGREAASPQASAAAAAPAGGLDDQDIAQLPESGRGLAIMQACVDDVTLHSGPGRGTVVSMRKRVAWRTDAPLTHLSAAG